jgi:tRNA U54 and U55 pseudouridine synthase Pus10
MSIETLTTDEFMDLEVEDHQEAVRQYNESIFALTKELNAKPINSESWNALMDRMARLFTLRKVHKVRLEEMEQEDAAEAAEMNGPTVAIAA